MIKNANINTRIDSNLKAGVEGIFTKLGLNHSTAIEMFYRQVLIHKGIPFKISIPNEETLRSMEKTENGDGLTEYNSIDEMIEDSKKW